MQCWIDMNPTASWDDVIAALRKLDHYKLAGELESEYCKPAADSKGLCVTVAQHNITEKIDGCFT